MEPQPAKQALPEFVALRTVRAMFGGASRPTILAMVDEGVLPRPIKPRANMVLFDRAALLDAVLRLRATA